MSAPDPPPAIVLDRAGLGRLVEVLIAEGYRVIGPTVRDNAIVLGELDSAAELPAGWGVETGPGHYRLRRRDDEAVFAHSAGPQSWKQFLHPPRRQLWSVDPGGRVPAPDTGFAAVRLPRRAGLRPGRDRDPGPRAGRRASTRTARSRRTGAACS